MTVVLITGCSSGIGAATAAELVADGHTVYATARRPETLTELADKGCRTLALDVTDESSMAAAVTMVEAEHGAVDVLVNNAGYSQSGAVESIPLDDIRRQFETNVFGMIRMSQLVLPGMRAAGRGRIINLGSMGGRLTFPGGGIYHATKYAVEAICDAMRFEVQGFGVQVVLIEPGLITTEFADTAVGSVDGLADGPYAEFNARVGAVTAEIYRSPVAKLAGGGPEAVAKVIRKAVDSKRPKARYAVTPSATLGILQRQLTPDRVWDLAMRVQFPVPSKD
ncbi:oxidoreductase [Skermania piniformis]|uniref:SDR family NAD(P)-dependent oxidoreductase n=1 Tax=Skermania pinensis TaxID=39122 RepID=A0ABX8S9L6_9ACTN|nr:oxidoreductase [Skermania piniformis]QXQ13250.1 SDR family NAD(P)-dependent oxidoreductase [Skermania piniformis]